MIIMVTGSQAWAGGGEIEIGTWWMQTLSVDTKATYKFDFYLKTMYKHLSSRNTKVKLIINVICCSFLRARNKWGN